MAPEPSAILSALHERLLSCVRRVLVIGMDVPAGAPAVFVSGAAAEAFEPQSFDAVILYNSTDVAAALQYLSADGAVFLAGDEGVPVAADLGLLVYVEWPGMVMAVREDYDPVAHAHRLLTSRRPHEAYEVLVNIPGHLVGTAQAKGLIAVETQWCLLALSAHADARAALNYFYRAQEQFFLATTYAPFFTPAYRCHARHWQLLGREDMAYRLLRTCSSFDSSNELRTALAELSPSGPSDPEEIPPEYGGGPGSMRVLLITQEGSDYGLDTLYDGLCAVLGDEAVVELPWKPTLHGQDAGRAEGYPCVYHRRGEPQSLQAVVSDLRDARYDLLVFADSLMTLDAAGVRTIAEAARGIPLVLVDTCDEGGDYRESLIEFLGRDACLAYFKREMIAGVDYGTGTFPLPFAYSDRGVVGAPQGPRDRAVFWAGKPAAGLRPVYLDRLRDIGLDVDRTFTQDEYRSELWRSRIGLNLFGYGFDTVRYWEVPAHGAMLLSERPPIRIPHNFEDGVHAVFFDDLPELETKLEYYLRHRDKAASIALAGQRHFLEHHTAAARARQFLGRVVGLMGGVEAGRVGGL